MATFKRDLYLGDNLDAMLQMEDESVDLIYLDPPFNKQRTIKASQRNDTNFSFDDNWENKEEVEDWKHDIHVKNYALHMFLESVGAIYGEKTQIYLTMMSIRLRELRRVLTPMGSIYLHCDWSASQILRVVMDCIFGKDRFRNEIAWCYPPKGISPKRGFHRKHDTILFYGKSRDEGTYYKQYRKRTKKEMKSYPRVDDNGRHYYDFTLKNGEHKRVYADEKEYEVPSYWTDIFPVGSTAKEKTGYPTQKPITLLTRIIHASSDKGDVVLDPFCGSGTTIVAAEQLGRQWIGIDKSEEAIELARQRIQNEVGILHEQTIQIPRRPEADDFTNPKKGPDFL